MLVLDTDHVSALGVASDASVMLLERIQASGEDAATTIVTVEEQLRGWLAEIHRLPNAHQQVTAYNRLQGCIEFFAAWSVLAWSASTADLFVRRIGTMDLKIACIALTHDVTLLTRNVSDFAKVPGLRFGNWLE